MSSKSDEAIRIFLQRFTCSAAVFSAFSHELGLSEDIAKKIGCGFGAGISRTGNMCGAASGAIMVIGLKYGKTEAADDAATEMTRARVRQFIGEFTRKNGSVNCTELLGYNLSDPQEYELARKSGLFVTKCPVLVRDAVEMLEGIL